MKPGQEQLFHRSDLLRIFCCLSRIRYRFYLRLISLISQHYLALAIPDLYPDLFLFQPFGRESGNERLYRRNLNRFIEQQCSPDIFHQQMHILVDT